MASVLCIYLSSRFGNCAVTFGGFSGVYSCCKIIVAVDGVFTVRFTNGTLSSGMLIHTRLIQVGVGHDNGCRGRGGL